MNWKETEYQNYYASPLGKIKRVYKNGRQHILTQYRSNRANGTFFVKIGHKHVRVGRLIYETFNGKTRKNIVHKNGVKSDNALSNLVALSNEELGKKYAHKTSKRMIVEHYENGELINTFRSLRAAAKELFVSPQTVSDIVNGKTKKPIYDLRKVKNC